MTAVLAATVAPAPARLRLRTTVLLHLVPGVAALIAYVALVPLAAGLGLPSVAALAGAGLLAVPAVQLGILLAHRRRHPSEPTVALRVDRLRTAPAPPPPAPRTTTLKESAAMVTTQQPVRAAEPTIVKQYGLGRILGTWGPPRCPWPLSRGWSHRDWPASCTDRPRCLVR